MVSAGWSLAGVLLAVDLLAHILWLLLKPQIRIRYADVEHPTKFHDLRGNAVVQFKAGSDSGSIPKRLGSQFVSCLSIDQATTAIFRASATAAFFLRVFCAP